MGIARRILLGCLIVVVASAATSAVFVSGEIGALTSAVDQNTSLSVGPGALRSAGFGDPQTLLLVGDDRRPLTKYYHRAVLPHSNEMLLVRFDPSKPWISMLSIPRDLRVTIHPRNVPPVTTRFNYAYQAGGIPLLLSTIKSVLGLSPNHVVVITFPRFKRAIDQMGCVYSTIDRRYYHSNVGSSEQYQEINLQPGYQKLCGAQALQFVSYRHGDTALVRDARNQSFLLDVKKQYGPTLAGNLHEFERIFGQAVQVDDALHKSQGILDLAGTLSSSALRRVRQVPFQVNLQPNALTATRAEISASVSSFLHGGHAPPRRKTSVAAHAVHRRQVAARLPLSPVQPSELAQARGAAASLPFPLEYPRLRDQSASLAPVTLRSYLIHGQDASAYPAYVDVVPVGALGQYYDVQGTTWSTAPQFAGSDQSIRVAGRTYHLYYEGQGLKMVVWYERHAVYWVRNTLLDSIGNGELLAIAEQTLPVGAGPVGPGRIRAGLGAVGPPPASPVSQGTGFVRTIGSLGGLFVLVLIPLLGLGFLRRRRELAGLRAQLRANRQREAQLAAAAHGTEPGG